MKLLLTTTALAGLEKLVNTALRYDPGTRAQLADLRGRTLAILVTAPEFCIYLSPSEEGLQLAAQWEGDIDTHLRGSLLDLIKLVQHRNTSVAGSGVEIKGDPYLLAELQRLLQNLDIDWEDALSGIMGDLAAHQSAQWIRSGAKYTQARTSEITRLLGEFLTEELRSVVARSELENFYREVDELRLSFDRLEARILGLMHRHSVSDRE